MNEDLDWFWQTDHVIAVIHVAGARGAAIHQLLTYSPEVDKRKAVEVHHGTAHVRQEGLGYVDPCDPNSQWSFYERWSEAMDGSSDTWPVNALAVQQIEKIKRQVSRLYTSSGYLITESVKSGRFLTYRNHPATDDGYLVFPNRRTVYVYHDHVRNSLREWHVKNLSKPMSAWQAKHVKHLSDTRHADLSSISTHLDYYAYTHHGILPGHAAAKDYLRSTLHAMDRNHQMMMDDQRSHKVRTSAFFTSQWQPLYHDLLDACGLSPNITLAKRFMDLYLQQQWRR